jgi:hypothetical protein
MPPPNLLQVRSRNAPLETPPWESAGIMTKRPPNCGLCRYQYKSTGFCPPFVGKDPKIAMVFPTPDSEEVINQVALDSARGRRFLREYCEPFGLDRENLVIEYVLHCLPPWNKRLRARDYPASSMRANAESVCDRFSWLQGKGPDLVPGGIVGWDPNLFVLAFDPADTIRIPALTRLIQRSVEKAAHFAAEGYRPCVLFGEESVVTQAPFIKGRGGLKAWSGHFFEGKWKSVAVNADEGIKTFPVR